MQPLDLWMHSFPGIQLVDLDENIMRQLSQGTIAEVLGAGVHQGKQELHLLHGGEQGAGLPIVVFGPG